MMRKVYLEGEIGEKFGKEFDIVAKSFSDVFRCLNGNFPEMQKYLIECDEKGIGFTCEVAGTPVVDERELLLQYPEGAMVISAVPAGSKSGGMKILAGIIIIGVTLASGGALGTTFGTWAAGTTAGSLSGWGIAALSIGVNLALTGFAQIMAPDPSVDSDQDQSYLFQGSGQNIVEGDPIPICYGMLRVPGRPISFRVKNQRQSFTSIYEVNTTPMDNSVQSEETVTSSPTAPPDIAPYENYEITIPVYTPVTYNPVPTPAVPTPSLGGGQSIKYSTVDRGLDLY